MADNTVIPQGGESNNVTLQAMKAVASDTAQELRIEQRDSQIDFQESLKELTNPFSYLRRQRDLRASRGRMEKMFESKEKSQKLLPVKEIQESANNFERRNPELKSAALLLLRDSLKPTDSKEEILRKVLEFYPDPTLADEVLEFLLATTEGELNSVLQEARETLNQDFQREIKAGRNINEQAQQASKKGLGEPTTLRDLYRDITGNPRDSTTLFEELARKYQYKDLKPVIDFLFHSIGADLNSKGPSIPRGLLHRLLTETRSLQAILGVYRFFKARTELIHGLFQKNGLPFPQQLSFEALAKQFMTLASDRYPSSSKVLQLAAKLGIEKWIMAKIIVISQLRDAIREVALHQIYKSIQHRDELFMAIIEALEELEDELDESMEEDEEEEEDEEQEQEEKEKEKGGG